MSENQLLGRQLQNSAEVQNLIKNLVAEVQKLSHQIRSPLDPQTSKASAGEQAVAQINALRGRPLFYPYVGTGVGRGPYVELEDGSVKIDLINGIGIHIMGHSHPAVIEACLEGALKDIVMQGHLQANGEYLKISEKLVSLASRKSRLKHVWLTTCGTMANENALKIVRQKKTPARKIIAMKDAFAGRSTMMAEVTDNPAFKQGLPEYNEVLRIPFPEKNNNGESLRVLKEHVTQHKNDICCFVFEPMLGEGGYKVPVREDLIALLDFCKQQGIPIWADEVQTFCRTGEFFAFETLDFGDYVDVVTIAKTAQVGATLYTEEYNPQPGLIAGTFASSSVSLNAGHRILDTLETQGYMGQDGKIAKIHKEFIGMLNRLNEGSCKGLLRDAGGLGLMVAVTPLDGSKEKQIELLKTLYKNGLMTFGCGKGPYRLRFLIPAVMTSEDIQVAEKIIEKSVLELA